MSAKTLDRGGANDDEITYPALVAAMRGGRRRRWWTCAKARIGGRPRRGQRRCSRCQLDPEKCRGAIPSC